MDMITELKLQLQTKEINLTPKTETRLTYRWLDVGVLELLPNQGNVQSAIVISAGIHGNETAPIELLNQLIQRLFAGALPLNVALLVILGNPEAILAGTRYVQDDLNRMFSGKLTQFKPSSETKRAQSLESLVRQFYESHTNCTKMHFDMHTAIRASHYPKFVLLPYQPNHYAQSLLRFFVQSELDAVVFHNAKGGTFSQFTASEFQAASCTLELGKARPFGQNDLSLYVSILKALENVISANDFIQSPDNSKTKQSLSALDNTLKTNQYNLSDLQMDFFKVHTSLLKQDEKSFKLNVKDDCPNFTLFYQNDCLLEQTIDDVPTRYCVEHEKEWILFPNPKVALGLRAAIMLTQIESSEALGKFI
ncbi:succinylglutamate desuccinylase [Thorsellia anophelis]|uniref:Succinylglutamate desuccinylase n=1 Tax=Thorsellia anophelis DSM 18579 TaxID=1123402 RepID=A0A1I0EW00_9GAMM|nr:succinylglutamate desuccinylase [Thorsellia anophelis]SET49536.1 succinylglutamate desuccinylase [Thorsellia anophelis DSM 18579]